MKHLGKELMEVVEAHYITGTYTILVKLICMDNDHLMSIFATNPKCKKGITRTETLISLGQ